MYKYNYVKTKTGDFWNKPSHQEIINEHARKGWRFVAAIPSHSFSNGKINEIELIFEKKEEEL